MNTMVWPTRLLFALALFSVGCSGGSVVAPQRSGTDAQPRLIKSWYSKLGSRCDINVAGTTDSATCYMVNGDQITVPGLRTHLGSTANTYPAWTCDPLRNIRMSYVSGGQPLPGVDIQGYMYSAHGKNCQVSDLSSFTVSVSLTAPPYSLTMVEMFADSTLRFGSQSSALTNMPGATLTVKPRSTAPADPAALAQAIFNAAVAQAGKSDAGYIPPGGDCAEGCVYTVNNIVHAATGKWIGGPAMANTDNVKVSGAVSQINQADAVPGNLMIVDSADGRDAHIGICLDQGCVTVNSNASRGDQTHSPCTFSFMSTTKFDYPGSPYHNGVATYWKVN